VIGQTAGIKFHADQPVSGSLQSVLFSNSIFPGLPHRTGCQENKKKKRERILPHIIDL
jgi:hypothetical protein